MPPPYIPPPSKDGGGFSYDFLASHGDESISV
jgi:hypothetical protein